MLFLLFAGSLIVLQCNIRGKLDTFRPLERNDRMCMVLILILIILIHLNYSIFVLVL